MPGTGRDGTGGSDEAPFPRPPQPERPTACLLHSRQAAAAPPAPLIPSHPPGGGGGERASAPAHLLAAALASLCRAAAGAAPPPRPAPPRPAPPRAERELRGTPGRGSALLPAARGGRGGSGQGAGAVWGPQVPACPARRERLRFPAGSARPRRGGTRPRCISGAVVPRRRGARWDL